MTDAERLAKIIVDSIITMPRWRFSGSVLLAFLVGWQFAPLFAAASWYRPATTIFRVLLLLGLVFVGISQLIQENKKASKKPFIDRVRMTYRVLVRNRWACSMAEMRLGGS